LRRSGWRCSRGHRWPATSWCDDIERRLSFCRLGRRGGTEALPFVRPYYDCAIHALIALEPRNTKQLIEIAWEATHGKPHFKSQIVGQATLVLYCSANQSYLLLDAPRGPSAFYPLPPGVDLEAIRTAAGTGRSEHPLPPELRKELLALSTRSRLEGGPMGVDVTWIDLVHEIGVEPSSRRQVAQLTAAKAFPGGPNPGTMTPASVPGLSTHAFPFAIPDVITALCETPISRPEEIEDHTDLPDALVQGPDAD
jgi:hypothetical protein